MVDVDRDAVKVQAASVVAEVLGAGEATNLAPVRMAIVFVLTAVIDKPISLGSDVMDISCPKCGTRMVRE
jgi:DNA polymerase III alpha subunit (gram-positive type)